jgi:threonine synthase
MGLPISLIVCGVNENREFPDFLTTGIYTVSASKPGPSSAMIVSHPSNLARLLDFYGGHIYDERKNDGSVATPGIIDKMPDLGQMRKDLYSVSIDNAHHYTTMKDVFQKYGVVLDPHGAVGWKSLEIYREGGDRTPAVIYETADPGKFPEDVMLATGMTPALPAGMKKQECLPERIYAISEAPDMKNTGMVLSSGQVKEAKDKIRSIFKKA